MTPEQELRLRERLEKGGLTPKQELAIRERLAGGAKAAAAKEPPIAQSIRSIAEGGSFGFSDEAVAAAKTAQAAAAKAAPELGPTGTIENPALPFIGKLITDAAIGKIGEMRSGEPRFTGYGQRLEQERAAQEAVPPAQRLAGNIAGGMLTGVGAGRAAAARAATPTARGIRGALTGGVAGTIYGAGSGRGVRGRMREAAQGAATGAATGGILGAGSGMLARRAARKAIPTTERLRKMATAAYERAEGAGIIISKDSFGKTVRNLQAAMANEGIDATIHPKVTAAMKRLMDTEGANVTLKGAQMLRRVIQSAARSTDPDERRLASIMLDKFDDYIENLGRKDVLNVAAGAAERASKSLKRARQLWSRYRKAEFLEGLIERAGTRAGQFTGSGFENALRTEFRRIALNAKELRRFSPAEQAAIKRVAKGGKLGNVFRWFGKFSPEGGVVSASLGTGVGGAVGAKIGGPAGAAIGAGTVAGLGAAGRRAATAATRRNASRAAELARAGGRIPAPITTPQARWLLGPVITGGAVGVQRPAQDFGRFLQNELVY